MVKVPPVMSSMPSLPVRVASIRASVSWAICARDFSSQFFTLGTIRPSPLATARPMFTCLWRVSILSAKLAFTSGTSVRALATTFIRMWL